MRELRQHASRYLLKVGAGETVEITQRGRLVALLVAPGASASARDRLVRSGRLAPAASTFEPPARRVHPAGAPTTDDALKAERYERPR